MLYIINLQINCAGNSRHKMVNLTFPAYIYNPDMRWLESNQPVGCYFIKLKRICLLQDTANDWYTLGAIYLGRPANREGVVMDFGQSLSGGGCGFKKFARPEISKISKMELEDINMIYL